MLKMISRFAAAANELFARQRAPKDIFSHTYERQIYADNGLKNREPLCNGGAFVNGKYVQNKTAIVWEETPIKQHVGAVIVGCHAHLSKGKDNEAVYTIRMESRTQSNKNCGVMGRLFSAKAQTKSTQIMAGSDNGVFSLEEVIRILEGVDEKFLERNADQGFVRQDLAPRKFGTHWAALKCNMRLWPQRRNITKKEYRAAALQPA